MVSGQVEREAVEQDWSMARLADSLEQNGIHAHQVLECGEAGMVMKDLVC